MDNKNALTLYKKYLGPEAENLPASALHFPLAVWAPDDVYENAVIRTILAIDEVTGSMTFAGDIPQGWHGRLMWGKFQDIVAGAGQSAQSAALLDAESSLSVMVSCYGRKSLMGQRISEELCESARLLGKNNIRIGFYSYGEIAPHNGTKESVLHNQTMTITTLAEK
jgi:hypothetical protein